MYNIDDTRTCYAEIPNEPDRELHVSAVTGPTGQRYAEVREFVPSIDTYGRGVLVPMRALDSVMDGLAKLKKAEDT